MAGGSCQSRRKKLRDWLPDWAKTSCLVILTRVVSLEWEGQNKNGQRPKEMEREAETERKRKGS